MTKQERKELRNIGRLLQKRIAKLDDLLEVDAIDVSSEVGGIVEQLIMDLVADANGIRQILRGDHAR